MSRNALSPRSLHAPVTVAYLLILASFAAGFVAADRESQENANEGAKTPLPARRATVAPRSRAVNSELQAMLSVQERRDERPRSNGVASTVAPPHMHQESRNDIGIDDRPQRPREQSQPVDPAPAGPSGAELFQREWVAKDPRSHGGDGLGPVFNESSCVACHNQGGVGGGGPLEKNVQLMTADLPTLDELKSGLKTGNLQGLGQIERQHRAAQETLFRIHPGFRKSPTVVAHRFGVDPAHTAWRRSLGLTGMALDLTPNAFVARSPFALPPGTDSITVAQVGRAPLFAKIQQEIREAQREIHVLQQQARIDLVSAVPLPVGAIQFSQRNTTALFGCGLIDDIPDEAVEAIARRKHAGFPEVSGRVHRLEDGRIGRFGWKAQKASLREFTVAACAVELGLHVPGHAQAASPQDGVQMPTGFDLNREEVQTLVNFLGELPRPSQRRPSHHDIAAQIEDGERLFAKMGCAACHVRKLGEVDGLFSDLLLHDMGRELEAVGSYGAPRTMTVEFSSPGETRLVPSGQSQALAGPAPQEWRTPPLWGVRDSAPYMHDGRAANLKQAIALHGGEAARSRLQFFLQTEEQRRNLVLFLKSLAAPDRRVLAQQPTVARIP